MRMLPLDSNHPGYTVDNRLRIIKMLEKITDVLLKSALPSKNFKIENLDKPIEQDFKVKIDMHSNFSGFKNSLYDSGIRELIYGFPRATLRENDPSLAAIETNVVVCGTTWTIQIGNERYIADITKLKYKPRNLWSLVRVNYDTFYKNPFRSFLISVNDAEEFWFWLIT